MVVTLEEMKEHLRIEQDDDTQDRQILSAIVAAEGAVRTHIDDGQNGDSVFLSEDESKREKGKVVVRMVAASLYEDRESEITGTVTTTKAFQMLIDQLKNY